ncbi:glycosyltransferase family 2 protein [Patescibacteria group bacterium]
MKIDVTIIILSYNTKKLTRECIESVYKFTKDVNFEIIVIDNASADESPKMLNGFSKKKNYTLIRNQKNIGFGRANNQGIERSKGRYILLLNSDTLLTKDSISVMVKFMDHTPRAGIASCKLLNSNGSNQSSGGYFPTLFRVFMWMCFLDDMPVVKNLFKSFHPEPFTFSRPQKVDWVMGSFFLMKADLGNDVGKFDKDYFMYTEEVDYCYRAKKLEWEVWYVPTTNIVHYGGASSSSEFVIKNEFKGITTFFRKHKGRIQQMILKVLLILGITLRMLLFGVLKGKENFMTYKNAFRYI